MSDGNGIKRGLTKMGLIALAIVAAIGLMVWWIISEVAK